jgi:hypothetical protein
MCDCYYGYWRNMINAIDLAIRQGSTDPIYAFEIEEEWRDSTDVSGALREAGLDLDRALENPALIYAVAEHMGRPRNLVYLLAKDKRPWTDAEHFDRIYKLVHGSPGSDDLDGNAEAAACIIERAHKDSPALARKIFQEWYGGRARVAFWLAHSCYICIHNGRLPDGPDQRGQSRAQRLKMLNDIL